MAEGSSRVGEIPYDLLLTCLSQSDLRICTRAKLTIVVRCKACDDYDVMAFSYNHITSRPVLFHRGCPCIHIATTQRQIILNVVHPNPLIESHHQSLQSGQKTDKA